MILIKMQAMKLNQLTPTTIACVTIFHLVALWLLVAFIDTPKIAAPAFASIEFVEIPSLADSFTADAPSSSAAPSKSVQKQTENKPVKPLSQEKPITTPKAKVITTQAPAEKADLLADAKPEKTVKIAAATPTATENQPSKEGKETKESAGNGSSTGATGNSNTNNAGQGSGMASTSATHLGGHLNNPKPKYPQISREEDEEGSVKMRVQVEPNGRPSNVAIAKSSGFPRLDNAAKAAVANWRFRPATRNREPITSIYEFPVNFSLKDRE